MAVVWLGALAKVHGLKLMPEMYAGLGLMVWGIYLVERMVDASRWHAGVPWTARHAFCAHNRRLLGYVVLPVLVGVLVWLALFRLPVSLVEHCVLVGVLVVAYLSWQMWVLKPKAAEAGGESSAVSDAKGLPVSPMKRGDGAEREFAKSIVAASLFALGVGAAVYAHGDRYPAWAVFAGQSLMTGLFAINLLGLSIVEGDLKGRLRQTYGLLWVLTLAGVVCVWSPAVDAEPPLRALSIGVMAGLLMMGVIHVNRGRLSAIAYRCWVDLALMLAGVLLWVLG